MENQIHFKEENEIPEWLQETFNTEEEYDEAMSDYEYIIERRLEEEKMKTIQEIKTIFEQILSEVARINGIPIESATQVATVILQESGKFERTEMMNQARQNNNYSNGNQQPALNNNGNGSNNGGKAPATDKQKNALDNFGITYSEDITKAEASVLLDKAISEVKKKRGGVITAPLSN